MTLEEDIVGAIDDLHEARSNGRIFNGNAEYEVAIEKLEKLLSERKISEKSEIDILIEKRLLTRKYNEKRNMKYINIIRKISGQEPLDDLQ